MSDLAARARKAAEHAYAPYSGYRVGAALISDAGEFVGANVENVSYGATICAERAAIAAMASAGGRKILALAVFTKDGGSPCGICRQVVAEFADADVPILLVGADGHRETTVGALLPEAFRSPEVRRT